MIYDVKSIDIAQHRHVEGFRENAGNLLRIECQLHETFAGHFEVWQVMSSRLQRLQDALTRGESVCLDWRRGSLGAVFLIDGKLSTRCWIEMYPLPDEIALRPPVRGSVTREQAERIIRAALAKRPKLSTWDIGFVSGIAAAVAEHLEGTAARVLVVTEEVLELYAEGRLGLSPEALAVYTRSDIKEATDENA